MDVKLRASLKKSAPKYHFFCNATSLTPLNVLCFVGTNNVRSDLHQTRAHEYTSTASQMFPAKPFFPRHSPIGVFVQPQCCLSSLYSVPGRTSEQGLVWF
ncbi:hypothetical protein CRENBAI_013899 [Crenichthys baileyi]|uniref:Uncharacterized protein n=1 Tax=Crenichthys baileyi TaxID=28760 RepID=A0AAV9SDR8_9TELE